MSGEINTNETFIYSTTGAKIKSFNELMNPIFNSERITPGKVTKGTYIFDYPAFIRTTKGWIEIERINYEFLGQSVLENVLIDEGKRLAELIIFSVLNKDSKIIFADELSKWKFNEEGEVVDKQIE